MIALLATALLASSGTAAPSRDAPDAVERLAAEVVQQLGAKTFEPPMGVSVDGSPGPLARALASLVAARLAAQSRAPVVLEAKSPADAEALARAKGLRSLVRVTVTVDGTRLLARGDALGTWVNFWSGQTETRSGAAVALAAAVDVDAASLSLLGVPSPTGPTAPASVELRLGVLAKLAGVPAALAVLDLDGDKRSEVVVLVDDEVVVLSGEGRQLARHELKGALSPTPTREPFGALGMMSGPARVVAWSARRARAEVLGWTGSGLKSGPAVDAVPVDGVVVKLEPGFNRFGAEVVWAGKVLPLPAPPQTLAAQRQLALAVYADGSGSLVRNAVVPTRFTGLGCGSTLADVDGDGTPELVITAPKPVVDGDDVRVVAASAAEAVQARSGTLLEAPLLWQGQTPRGRVVVAAGGDLDGDGVDEVVLGSWLGDGSGELLFLRKATP